MIIKLNSTHVNAVKNLFFTKQNHMGVNALEFSASKNDVSFQERSYEIFCDNYLSDLDSFHAYGYINPETENVDALISYCEIEDDPSWYFTIYRSSGNNQLLKDILDKVIEVNEQAGRYKFFTLVNSKHSRLLRKFTWNKYNIDRYDYVDECIIPAKTKPYYINHWEILFKRVLIPVDTTVRCNFLKQSLRETLPKFGKI